MDIEGYLTQMEQLLDEARPVPLSASVMVNKRDFEELLQVVRARLPEELRQSRWVLKERDEVLAQATREAGQVVEDARRERDRLVSETEVVHTAQREAERILSEARDQARTLRLEAEDYVDSKLANFEIVLQKTMRAVEKGRERLRGRLATDELAAVQDEPLAEDASGELDFSETRRQLYDHEATE